MKEKFNKIIFSMFVLFLSFNVFSVASNFEDIKAETDKLGIKLAKTEGAQYIKLTRDGQGALNFVQEQFEN